MKLLNATHARHAPASMECKASGVLDTTKDESALTSLQERLSCISGEHLAPFKQLEILLLGPSYTSNTKGPELRLVQQLKEPDTAQHKKGSSAWKVIKDAAAHVFAWI